MTSWGTDPVTRGGVILEHEISWGCLVTPLTLGTDPALPSHTLVVAALDDHGIRRLVARGGGQGAGREGRVRREEKRRRSLTPVHNAPFQKKKEKERKGNSRYRRGARMKPR